MACQSLLRLNLNILLSLSKMKRIKKDVKSAVGGIVKKEVSKRIKPTQLTRYVSRTLFGNIYSDIYKFFGQKFKKKVVPFAGKYALKKFVRSEFAQSKANIIPLTITSLLIRLVFNSLLSHRLRTSIWYLEMMTNICVNVGISLASPIFYAFAESQNDYFAGITRNITETLMKPSDKPVYIWSNMYFSGLVMVGIGYLSMVEITSVYLQVQLIQMLISGWIIDLISYIRYRYSRPYRLVNIGITRLTHIPISISYDNPERCMTRHTMLNTRSLIIEDYQTPQVATILTRSDLRSLAHNKSYVRNLQTRYHQRSKIKLNYATRPRIRIEEYGSVSKKSKHIVEMLEDFDIVIE